MSSKPKAEAKVAVLKGQEAEDAVLAYIKRMNRPFGAVDVSANLKGAVPKAATQKIMVALAEKGELVQKTYGKTTFFVANQANLEDMPAEKLKKLEEEHKTIEEANKALAAELRTANAELAKLKATPTDAELDSQLRETAMKIKKCNAHLEPLRSGSALVSAEDLAQLDKEWTQWRAEWVRRKKIFHTFWALATDALPPQDAAALAEDLGIEYDSGEHAALEKGALCAPGSVLGKRSR
ncbi:TBPIP-domain-containing protein [Phanerochaete sordida]|uniref:TBPIP-domain-containing protein n=1 Tax=Phanerochaete sordida TaxID=48140 RepID=A0A9P3G7I3_9APHY|nr:TBPIP-domain-containing protein [Phanerochaete sordida]